ncbi:MAG TPA: RebB family R body protein, partial [Thermoanaerobaculia bacterium]|nr:RebB family R body protein [Thermoanaerobaculia bacterium]
QEILEWSSGEEGTDEEAIETMHSSLSRLKEAGERWESAAEEAETALRDALNPPAETPRTGGDFRQQALAAVYAAAAQAISTSFHNTVAAQQQLQTLGQAVLAQSAELVTDLIEQLAYEDEDEDLDES